MSGTQAGGLNASKTNKRKFGKDYYQRIGAMGGRATGRKGFALSGKASEAGRKGGANSKRTWTPEQKAFQAEIMRENMKRYWAKKDLLGYEEDAEPFWDYSAEGTPSLWSDTISWIRRKF